MVMMAIVMAVVMAILMVLVLESSLDVGVGGDEDGVVWMMDRSSSSCIDGCASSLRTLQPCHSSVCLVASCVIHRLPSRRPLRVLVAACGHAKHTATKNVRGTPATEPSARHLYISVRTDRTLRRFLSSSRRTSTNMIDVHLDPT